MIHGIIHQATEPTLFNSAEIISKLELYLKKCFSYTFKYKYKYSNLVFFKQK